MQQEVQDIFCTSQQIRKKFGNVGDTDEEFEALCDLIIGKAMEGYVRSEYGNLWETRQCRPHAYGHNWSPGIKRRFYGL